MIRAGAPVVGASEVVHNERRARLDQLLQLILVIALYYKTTTSFVYSFLTDSDISLSCSYRTMVQ